MAAGERVSLAHEPALRGRREGRTVPPDHADRRFYQADAATEPDVADERRRRGGDGPPGAQKLGRRKVREERPDEERVADDEGRREEKDAERVE